MANEITALEQQSQPGGAVRIGLFFIYPISAPAQVGGSNVVPTPYTVGGLPAVPPIADAVITQPEKDSLDAGTSAFEGASFTDQTGLLTGAQMLARAQEVYTARKTAFDTEYVARYKFAGDRGDAI